MSEFKGTIGTWFYRPDLAEVVCVGNGIIADVISNGSEDENGRLITAAPVLLEACLRSRNQLYAAGYESKEVSLNPTEELLFQLESAIKKALGK
ncbi:hypothetical protein [Rahnella bonaserana]|uniref:hypothetical protein n=1 Tax=Rahnella bonaserana TaxID=2816248 RepID=UPI00320999A4